MAGPAYFRVYPLDEQRETKHLSLLARGLRASLRAALWLCEIRGEMTMTVEQWSRELSCSEDEFRRGIQELADHQDEKSSDIVIEYISGDVRQKVRVLSVSIFSFELKRLRNSKHQSTYRCKAQGNESVMRHVSSQVSLALGESKAASEGLSFDDRAIRMAPESLSSPSQNPDPVFGESLTAQEIACGIGGDARGGKDFSDSLRKSKGPGKRPRPLAPTLLPEDFTLTPELVAFAKTQGVLDPESEFEKFRDRNRSVGARYLDWTAALRNWFRNVRQYTRRQSRGGGLVTS